MNSAEQKDYLIKFFNEEPSHAASKRIPNSIAYAVRFVDGHCGGHKMNFGIFVPVPNLKERNFRDDLNAMRIFAGRLGWQDTGIVISCSNRALLDVFCSQCVQLIEINTIIRIQQDYLSWWSELKELTGNSITNNSNAFVFAEFATYLHLVNKHRNDGIEVKWNSCGALHDIETSDGAQHEVKSTTSHHQSIIEASSEFQLLCEESEALSLYFCRLDADGRVDGKSIDDLVCIARKLGCDLTKIENILEKQKLPICSLARRTKYKILEVKFYDVSKSEFPKFTRSDIPERCHPEHISEVKCSIDLAGLSAIANDLTHELSSLIC